MVHPLFVNCTPKSGGLCRVTCVLMVVVYKRFVSSLERAKSALTMLMKGPGKGSATIGELP